MTPETLDGVLVSERDRRITIKTTWMNDGSHPDVEKAIAASEDKFGAL